MLSVFREGARVVQIFDTGWKKRQSGNRRPAPSGEGRFRDSDRTHISATRKKRERAGTFTALTAGQMAGFSAGLKSPVTAAQVFEFIENFEARKIFIRNPPPVADFAGAIVTR
jgi:hypothetical protein